MVASYGHISPTKKKTFVVKYLPAKKSPDPDDFSGKHHQGEIAMVLQRYFLAMEKKGNGFHDANIVLVSAV